MENQLYSKLNSPITEKSLIGSVMVSPDNFLQVSWLKPECFYIRDNANIWAIICDMFNEGAQLDISGLSARLKKRGADDRLSVFYVLELYKSGVAAENVTEAAQFIYDLYIKRELYVFLERKMLDVANLSSDTEDVSSEILLKINNLHNDLYEAESMSVKEVISQTREQILKRKFGEEAVNEIDIGIGNIKLTNGLIIIAARPSMGKSSMIIQMCNNIAVDGNIPIALFELEMSKEQIARWMISQRSGIDNERLRIGNLDEDEINIMEQTISKIESAPLFIDDTASINVMQLKAKAMKLKNKYDIKAIFVDYLQLMNGMETKGKIKNRENEVSEISRQLKIMSKDIGIPVVALSQLNRELMNRSDKKPRLSDLRESGSIEQDADMVIFIHREEYYGVDNYNDGTSTHNVAELIIEKYRDGALRTSRVNFLPDRVTFRDFASDYEYDAALPYKDDDKF